ncbi:MAG: hypothetical protein QOJ32_620 [Frankiaceae bacterium]|jgi:type IV secretory pathway TrbD component|nr:hypothetical protein [Frankiaceae bacterium]MDQ1633811.1 hypothetical protein [Frankiaceae bacterium]
MTLATGGTRSRLSGFGLRLLTAAGLAYSAYAHWHLHAQYAENRTSLLSQSDVFVVQAVACVVAAVLLLALPGRIPLRFQVGVWLLAFAVAAGSLAAVFIYRYADLGRIGPLPDMYEPVWYSLKTRSAVAEAVAATASAAGLLQLFLARRQTR